MRCPYCGEHDTKVIDSRLTNEADQVRRRRECIQCNGRFTTYEAVELSMPRVVKSNGSRELFLEAKLRNGLLKALEKRPVDTERVEIAITQIKRALLATGEREIESRRIGDLVMQKLRKLDHVAYIRFASVYLSFEDINAFREVIDRLEMELSPEMRRDQISFLSDES